MNQSWKAQKERSNPFAISVIRWVALNLGRNHARLLLHPITLYFLFFAPTARKGSLLYLKRVLDHKPTWIDVARHIHTFSATLLDRIFLLTNRFDAFDIEFPAVNLPLHFSKKGSGCILLGSHIGSFEVLRSYAIKKCPLPVKIMMYEEHNPMIIKMFNSLNSEVSDAMINLGERDSFLQVKDSIELGYAVGMLGDRAMGAGKTVKCQLFGDEIELPIAPVQIAASLKVPLILFFGLYLGGNKYQIHFELLAEKIELRRENRLADIQFWTQEYANIIENYLREAPFNWFNFYDYWLDENKHQ